MPYEVLKCLRAINICASSVVIQDILALRQIFASLLLFIEV